MCVCVTVCVCVAVCVFVCVCVLNSAQFSMSLATSFAFGASAAASVCGLKLVERRVKSKQDVLYVLNSAVLYDVNVSIVGISSWVSVHAGQTRAILSDQSNIRVPGQSRALLLVRLEQYLRTYKYIDVVYHKAVLHPLFLS